MAATISTSTNFVEGSDRTRRFTILGDTSYPAGGYDILSLIKTTPAAGGSATSAPVVIKRIIAVRHATLASSLVGDPVFEDTYTNGVITGLTMRLRNPGATAELATGTTTANLNVVLQVEGF